MPKRPALTEDSFLRHLFSPKKNPLPTGLRKRALAFSKGRTKARVASYNRMSAANQELLKRSGQRDAYLRGEATLTDARKSLRNTAVGKGIAKPLKTAKKALLPATPDSVADHVIREFSQAHVEFNATKLRNNIEYMPEADKRMILKAKVDKIKQYAGDKSKDIIYSDGEKRNPLWYK